MEPRTARHHWGPNLAQYHYVEKKYGKKARAQAFWATTGLLVLIIGSFVVIQMSETDVQRKARVEAQEAFYVRVACKLGDPMRWARFIPWILLVVVSLSWLWFGYTHPTWSNP